MMVNITVCRYCTAPKRYPGCGDNCKEYREEKEKKQRVKDRITTSKEADYYTRENAAHQLHLKNR